MKNLFLAFIIVSIFSCDIINNNNSAKINNEAITLMEKGDLKNAIIKFKKALYESSITDELKLTVTRNIALVYNDMTAYDSAAVYFKKAAEIDNKKGYFYNINMSDYQILQEDIQGAYEFCLRAYEIDSNKFEANSSLGLFYMGEYDEKFYMPEKALKHNLLAYKINPQKNSELNLAKNYYYLENYEKSISMFESLNRRYPNDLIILESLIINSDESNNKEKLEVYLKKYQAIDSVGYQNVLIYLNQKEAEQAQE